MTQLDQQILSGCLLGWRVATASLVAACRDCPGISISPTGAASWDIVTLRSSTPLAHEFEPEQKEFLYKFLIRQNKEGGSHALLASQGRVYREFLKYLGFSGFIEPAVLVDDVVNYFIESPDSRYTVSRLYAHVNVDGDSLRTLALYGDDIIDSGMFKTLARFEEHRGMEVRSPASSRNIEGALQPYRIELRHVTANTNVLSINSRGEITFFYRGIASLQHVIDALSFLNHNGFIQWNE